MAPLKSKLSALYLFSEGPGGRAGLYEHRPHAGPPGCVLQRVPPQLHPLPEDLRAAGGLPPLALPLPGLQGGLPGHHAVQLVGGTHSGPGVDEWGPHNPAHLGGDKREESDKGWGKKGGVIKGQV